jgi:D-alanyl-lipoteichoic acid acyltransferase DltB (MBOAT superfamily)
MTYILGAVFVAIAVVLFVFTGIWGGLLWILVAAVALAVVFFGRARTVERARTEPTGTPRKSRGGAETANERVGQT